ncbi:MAG: FHA domain-containing protein [Pseudobutyrivibrio sp.]|nr:FHA domain-containing protein [Pseudobutyrivibrio sp.]
MERTDITFERKHNESYMIIAGKLDVASYETRMIKENNIDALLDMTSISIDGKNKISYKISRKENLEDFVEANDLTGENLERLILNIKIALDTISNYLIDEEHILLWKETIFLEKGSDNYQIKLCYTADKNGTIQEQFRELMEFFISKLTISDREASKQIYKAYDLCLKDDYTLDEIVEALQNESISKPEIYVEQVSLEDEEPIYEVTEDSIDSEYISDYYDVEKQSFFSSIFSKIKNLGNKMSFQDIEINDESEDFVIDPEYELEEKTVLLSETKPVGRLVYDGNSNEDDFIITKDIFRIGTSKNNDAILKSRTVSGNHAKITKDGNDFYITDSNSLNGSFLNSLPLAYRKPYKLKPMDVIRFATESYIFY